MTVHRFNVSILTSKFKQSASSLLAGFIWCNISVITAIILDEEKSWSIGSVTIQTAYFPWKRTYRESAALKNNGFKFELLKNIWETMKQILSLFLPVGNSLSLYAQPNPAETSRITGEIYNGTTNEPLAGVNISIIGTTLGFHRHWWTIQHSTRSGGHIFGSCYCNRLYAIYCNWNCCYVCKTNRYTYTSNRISCAGRRSADNSKLFSKPARCG